MAWHSNRTQRVIRSVPGANVGGGDAYRIEWPDGEPTGSGLFVGAQRAQEYANGRGWPVRFELDRDVEDCA
jgi:hypothetical protein